MNPLPLVARPSHAVIARRVNQDITVGEFCADVMAQAKRLPKGDYVINLCQDRYHFWVTFFAALANQQTNLLPAKREGEHAKHLADQYGNATIASDNLNDSADVYIDITAGSSGVADTPMCKSEHIAAIAFTSGSTGEPQAHPKTWRMLHSGRQVHQRYLPDGQQNFALVATVPSWHMYGLEWAMLLPTVAPITVYCGADFYPQDVNAALAGFDAKTILVSTPVHLRALAKTANPPTNLHTVICATAPLDQQLTQRVEDHFNARLFEIYGCSEIGSLAFRFPSQTNAWAFFDCFDLEFNEPSLSVSHAELPAPVILADAFALCGRDSPVNAGKLPKDATFELLGRTTDLIKVGGKRESLANLNNILSRIPGVEDGVIYQPESLGLPDTGRLAALIVAPGHNPASLRAALAQHMDSTFLPRPIRLVAQLPRDNTSKLKRAELVKLAAQHNPT